MSEPLLQIERLTLALPEGADRRYAVEDVSYSLAAGEVLCVVGESGSGKSMTANAVMGLLPPGLRVTQGRALFDGADLLAMDEPTHRALRGRRIGMVFQEPMTALNPLMRVGDQIAEVFEAHGLLTARERREKALALLEEVRLPDPPSALRAYPFELSGGQRQRVMIAMALALEPQLLVADEPTTALDVTTQAQILHLIRDLQKRRGMAVMFITHDFGVVAEIADRVCVMCKGRIVEMGDAREVLASPRHAYTRTLIAAIPGGVAAPARDGADPAPLLTVEGLNKVYRSRGGWWQPRREVVALDEVGFTLGRGETLGIVGESGSGKSTLGRCIVGLETPDSGGIRLAGTDLRTLTGQALREQRRHIQMVFQDPYASLNPRIRVGMAIAQGPIANGVPRARALERARQLLTTVGLDAAAADRFPHEFSGGQRQRIGIARALALDPELIVADEAVSALDVSIQAQVLELLERLKTELSLSLLFITHDLRVAAQICDRLIVMQTGCIVEQGSAERIFQAPSHPYTRELLAAIPGRHDDATAPAAAPRMP
ncbi:MULTISPECIES: ABC transporter ATP-binding protein [unclassified Modicisalibacter]|uniref:ABC transporter ATP-binding protein n=1 Tax=unclassified Modicisalibacter TaxID=2679913 RepID=UPI001CCB13C5|nr:MULTISPECIES: ABC transporter ATP-binding protein [unclassified Modicisalibacter]MBZ9558409.1 ABC transporter ATP-binding protein [Modicisalibacter sp. R2A 31.J]MBZ9575699.1 ABC transporter ATP-binding protein [Modicisalibacter sp. MOD 31.J]